MATKTSNTYAPLEYFTAGEAAQLAIPSSSVLGKFVKFGKNDQGQTIFEYIDPDKQWTEQKYPVLSTDKYGYQTKDYAHPIVNPATGDYNWPSYYSDGTPVTNKTYLNRSGDALAISPDGRSLMSTMTGSQRSVTGMSAGMGYTLNGSGMNETLTFSGDNGWVSGKFTTPTYGVADIPTDGTTDLSGAYQKYLGQFAQLAKGVQSRITSKTVTDEGILGDIKDTIGKLGPLAPLALNFAFPGLGSAIGAALGATGAVAGVIGNTLINTVMNGGDVGKALSGSLIGATGLEAGSIAADIAKGGEFGSFLQSNPQLLSNVANNVTQAALKGQDVESVLGSTLLGSGVSMATSQIPGYNELAPTVKSSVDAAISGALQGKDVTSAAISAAIKAGQSAIANSTNVPTEDQVLKDQKDLQDQLAGFEDTSAGTGTLPGTDTGGFPPQDLGITPENLASYQQTLSENFQGSQWAPSENGDYTLTGDDGSTITMHKDGTVSSTDAPAENLLDTIGKGTTTGGTKPAGGTTTGGTTTSTTPTTPPAKTGPSYEQQLAGLAALLDADAQQTQVTTQEPSADTTSGAAPIPAAVNYLGELAEKPRYLEGMDPEVVNMLQQLGIDPAQLMGQQEGDAGEADDHAEEGVDVLEARGRLEGYNTPDGVKRGLPPGTFGLAGTDVAKAYRAAMADRNLEYGNAYKQPIDMYNQAYLKKLAPAAEAALNESWGPIVRGKGISLAGSDAPIRRDMANEALAYVPTASIATSKYYEGAGLAPQLIAMVGENPQLLNDPNALAMVMSHELAHRAPQRSVEGPSLSPVADAAKQAAGLIGAGAGRTQADLYKGLAGARDYLSNQYGYKGVYDYKQELPLEELLADIGGWSQQSGVNITKDPYILKNVLNTPEKMAVYNVMHPNRSVQSDPFFPPVGTITTEDFLPYEPPVGWAAKNMDPDQFKAMLKKRMTGMFGK